MQTSLLSIQIDKYETDNRKIMIFSQTIANYLSFRSGLFGQVTKSDLVIYLVILIGLAKPFNNIDI